jgi:CBS-domain-containing membrane protein
MHMMVRDVMSTRVVAVRKRATFKDMAARLREQRVSAFPVLDDDDKVIGVVSEADLLAKVALDDRMPRLFPGMTRAREEAKADGVIAADLMTAPPATVLPGDSVAHAARLMYDRRVKRLPVIDGRGRLIGIVARSDVLSVYGRPDDEIRREILQGVIGGEFRCDPRRFTVTVRNGIVTLEGGPATAAVRRGIVDAARHTEAVVSVRDRLTHPAHATATRS